MADDDPFGLNDRDRTQMPRPQPGGRGPARPAAPEAPMARPVATGAGLPRGTPGRGPLVEAAFGILSLVPLLRSRTPPTDPDTLRAQIERELQRFSDNAQAQGLDQRAVAVAHYCLCALVDDIVLNTPWGAHGTWRSRSLAGTLHHDVAAGERFFDYLDQAKKVPERNRPVLELMYVCLSLGFEGRYRLVPQGLVSLQQIRAELASLLARLDGTEEPDLSGTWRGVEAAYVPIVQRIPSWVFGAATLALLVLVYVAFALRLGGIGMRLDAVAASLPPPSPVTIVRQGPPPPPPPPPPRATALEPKLRDCLPEPGKSRPDSVSEDLEKVRVRLPNNALFASGSADLQASVEPIIVCIARVLAPLPGKVLVNGHSDNVPIHTARFPSNWELSKARADAVTVVMREIITDDNRLKSDGRADTQPVAPNTTEDGKGQNRRVEVVLLK